MFELTEEQQEAVRKHKEAFKKTNGWLPLNGSPIAIEVEGGIEILEGVKWND